MWGGVRRLCLFPPPSHRRPHTLSLFFLFFFISFFLSFLLFFLFFKVPQFPRNIYGDIKRDVQVSGPNRARSRFSNYFLAVTFACDPTALLPLLPSCVRPSPHPSFLFTPVVRPLSVFFPSFPARSGEHYGRRERARRGA